MNAADESQVKAQEKHSKFARQQEVRDVCELLSLPAGRRFLWRYLETCGVYKLSFDHSGSITSFREGARNVGLKLLSDITEASPDSLILMMKEAKDREVKETPVKNREKDKET